MIRAALVLCSTLAALPAYAITVEDCRRTFDAQPTELAWCLASLEDESKCRNHPKLSATEETFCWAAASGYGKCSALGDNTAPARIACEALAKDRWSDCADAVTEAVEKKGGAELEEAKAAAAFCWAFTKPVRSTCAGAVSEEFTRQRCEWMVDARLVFTGKVPPVQALPPITGTERDGLKPPPPETVRSSDLGQVADWAKEQYRQDAPATLIASMTSDGKIGSIYFDDGRIRTVHDAGPEEEISDRKRFQFNIDREVAAQEYYDKIGKSLPYETEEDEDDYWDGYNRWLVAMLTKASEGSFPSWITRVDGPTTALVATPTTPPPESLQLVEIFFDINGDVESWHPSRGAAVKFETNKQVISVLRAGIKYLEDQNITEPAARNRAFYDFIKARIPNLDTALNMRAPDEL